MTLRERLALAAVLTGIALIVVCATALGGWPVGCGSAGVLLAGFGILLGIDVEPAASDAAEDEEDPDLTGLELLPAPEQRDVS